MKLLTSRVVHNKVAEKVKTGNRLFKLVWLLPGLLIAILGFGDYYYYEYTPVLLKRADLETSIKYLEARNIESPGKIYVKDSLIFISDKYKGIHVVNNKDSIHPQRIGFINIPGCLDMAVKGQYLYVDNAVDLVTIDLSAFPTIAVTSRIREVFPEIPSPQTGSIPSNYTKEKRPAETVIVDWIKKGTN